MSPSKEYSGLISFRTDWSDLLAVQGTLKSLLQHHNSKASILQHSAFFMVQLSHSYMTPGKTITLTIQTFVCKVMSLCFLLCCLGLSQLFFQRANLEESFKIKRKKRNQSLLISSRVICVILGEEFCTCIPADLSEIFNNTKSIWEVNKEQLFTSVKKKKKKRLLRGLP